MAQAGGEPAEQLCLGEKVIGRLLDESHRLHPDRLAPMVARELAGLGMSDVVVYVVDFEQHLLMPLPGDGLPDHDPLDIEATTAGRAFRTEQLLEEPADDGRVRMWIPVVDGSERLGILGVTVAAVDELLRRRARHVAAVVASMVVSKKLYGDRIELTRRLRPMDLAAELRWTMLPPLTYVNDRVAISGILVPAYEIAGDSFDYAMNGDVAHVAIVDAMGHGLEASRMANLALASYRSSRRQGLDLIASYSALDRIVSAEFGPDKFVTGQLASMDVTTGTLTWLNAGHPAPILLRGRSSTIDLTAEVSLPMGLGDVSATLAEAALEPGDCVLFFTDGVSEARSRGGELFGRKRLAELLVQVSADGETPAEMMRRLCHAVLAHQHETLQDDATLLVVCWMG